MIRVDAEIRQGNSGGPLLDEEGRVVGVVFALDVNSGDGLAVPIDTLLGRLDGRDLAPPTATRMLDGLERESIVERRPSEEDRRCVTVELTGIPTFLDGDAKALALGEGWQGAARGVADFVAMVVSTGVGGGIEGGLGLTSDGSPRWNMSPCP